MAMKKEKKVTEMNTEKFDIFTYERYFNDGRCIIKNDTETICLFEVDGEFGKKIEPNEPDSICTQIMYNQDTLMVSCIGQYIKGWNIEVGVWREYDKFGEVVYEDDKDKHYPIKWEDMLERFRANGINPDEITMLKRSKNRQSDRYEWMLTLTPEPKVSEIVRFDAETGEITERIKETL